MKILRTHLPIGFVLFSICITATFVIGSIKNRDVAARADPGTDAVTHRIEFVDTGGEDPKFPRIGEPSWPKLSPRAIVICVGDSVEFVNIWNGQVNAFSYSAIGRFDTGRFRTGESRTVGPFQTPGLVRVYDEIHANVKGFILVVDCSKKKRSEALSDGLGEMTKILEKEYPRPKDPPAGDVKPPVDPTGGEFEARIETGRGLHVATLKSPNGRIIARFPDDMAAGDSILFSVRREPAGSTEEERGRNLAELTKCRIVIEGSGSQPLLFASQQFETYQWSIPADLHAGLFSVNVVDENGRVLSRIELPPPQPFPPYPCPLKPLPGDFRLPTIGQPGRPVEIHGPFIESRPPGIRIGDHAIYASAVSPRKCVIETPPDLFGETQLRLDYGDVRIAGELRIVRVRLQTTKRLLQPNETAIVTAEFDGLSNLAREVTAALDVSGPVRMSGGNSQTITIRPADIQAGGGYTLQRTITGEHPGDYQVTAVITDECSRLSSECESITRELAIVQRKNTEYQNSCEEFLREAPKDRACQNQLREVAGWNGDRIDGTGSATNIVRITRVGARCVDAARNYQACNQSRISSLGPRFDALMKEYAECLRKRAKCASHSPNR